MTPDDEKDLQQILFLASRILERLHIQGKHLPALNVSPPNPTHSPQAFDANGKILSFPVSQSLGKESSPLIGEGTIPFKAGSITFSEQELAKMPKQFRKLFRINHKTAHVRRKDGVYEIRLQLDGVRISASAKFLDDAKIKFIRKLQLFEKGELALQNKKNNKLFTEYMTRWLEVVKKPYIKESTYKMYLQLFNGYILPSFHGRTIASLSQFELQEFINGFADVGKNRTAQKLALLISAVLDYATDDGIIARSPMKRVIVPIYEEEHGQPITRAEESRFIFDFRAAPDIYKQAFVFMLYTGVRRSELASVRIFDGWIFITTSKQRKGLKEKIRKLPIPPMLAPLLPLIELEKVKSLAVGSLTKRFKDFFPAHHLHDLRHTFITRAQECHIQRELVSLWAGHAADSSITSSVYTHLEQNEQHQRDEMNKFRYDLE